MSSPTSCSSWGHESRDARLAVHKFIRAGDRVLDVNGSTWGVSVLATTGAAQVVSLGAFGSPDLFQTAKTLMVENKFQQYLNVNAFNWMESQIGQGKFDVFLLNPPRNKNISDASAPLRVFQNTLTSLLKLIDVGNGALVHLIWTHSCPCTLEQILKAASSAATDFAQAAGDNVRPPQISLIAQGAGASVDFPWNAEVPRLGANPFYTFRVQFSAF
eukprot:GDKK01044044.1.p1 GENE.GDKK01044044.1~~GDKK01044044.1.p1  ORF type:complete len:226 (+),score=39.84 GDKK01044044.1:33-680(+)